MHWNAGLTVQLWLLKAVYKPIPKEELEKTKGLWSDEILMQGNYWKLTGAMLSNDNPSGGLSTLCPTGHPCRHAGPEREVKGRFDKSKSDRKFRCKIWQITADRAKKIQLECTSIPLPFSLKKNWIPIPLQLAPQLLRQLFHWLRPRLLHLRLIYQHPSNCYGIGIAIDLDTSRPLCKA